MNVIAYSSVHTKLVPQISICDTTYSPYRTNDRATIVILLKVFQLNFLQLKRQLTSSIILGTFTNYVDRILALFLSYSLKAYYFMKVGLVVFIILILDIFWNSRLFYKTKLLVVNKLYLTNKAGNSKTI